MILAMAGCLSSPQPTGASESGFFGIATLGPTCPVQQEPPDPDCADRPFEGEFALTARDGGSVVQVFASDARGSFNVTVPPGEYAIRLADETRPFPRCASAAPVVIVEGAWLEANVSCDSGIR